ncbi:hypothetical protein [Streptomyces sp. Y1]|uniref:Uncharacterized protein n=1 Tax=Streptomyces sp. Y1 TaxID=3238634 RepID=A0AB39TGB3_9ACTN
MAEGREPALVPGVVGALVRLAQGVAGGPGRAVAEVVRARLRATPEGARAVDAVAASPGDERARAELTAAVTELLATDEAFAQYVRSTELGRPADPPTVHLRLDPAVTGARALAARRGNVAIVAALALVLVTALVALGMHLGSRPLLKPDGPHVAHGGQALREPAGARKVLPDVGALPPGGWQVESGPDTGTSGAGDAPCLLTGLPATLCSAPLTYATVTFRASPAQHVQFTVLSFDSAEIAARAFTGALDFLGSAPAATPVPLPPIGDQSAARANGPGGVAALVRVGGTLLYVRDSGPGASAAAPALPVFARLLAERARLALDGADSSDGATPA